MDDFFIDEMDIYNFPKVSLVLYNHSVEYFMVLLSFSYSGREGIRARKYS